MPLLVVPLHPDDVSLLTLAELELLTARTTVVFERAAHPLAERLTGTVEVRLGGAAPDASDGNSAYVADPETPRLVELARAGATVTAGAARPPDSLSAAHAASIARRAGAELAGLAVVMARLRSPDGCPWDREQDHRSLTVHLIEEAAEVLDAIDRGSLGAELEEELGDVLLQVFFHAQMAAGDGRFDISGVARSIVAKLVHRHPHVFGDVEVADAAEVVANWEAIKAAEKAGPRAPADLLEGIPRELPALLAAHKVQKRAAGRGFRPDAAATRAALEEALRAAADTAPADGPGNDDALDAAVGDLLFWAAALGRARGIEAEGALRRSVRRFAQAQAHRGGAGAPGAAG